MLLEKLLQSRGGNRWDDLPIDIHHRETDTALGLQLLPHLGICTGIGVNISIHIRLRTKMLIRSHSSDSPLMVQSFDRLKAQGSRLKAQGSRFTTNGRKRFFKELAVRPKS
jgi:hypothetical protein